MFRHKTVAKQCYLLLLDLRVYLWFPQFWCVAAFATAEEFRLEELQAALSDTNLYEPTCLYRGCDDVEGESNN